MSEPAVFDRNMVNSWFIRCWKEQSLRFKNHVLKHLSGKFKEPKTEFEKTAPKMVSYASILEKWNISVPRKAFRCCKEAKKLSSISFDLIQL